MIEFPRRAFVTIVLMTLIFSAGSFTPLSTRAQSDASVVFTWHTIEGNFDAAVSVYATDVDGDGDVDVLGAAAEGDDIAWWENDGDENFTGHTIEGNFDWACEVYATDVDGDGDVDVLGAAFYLDDITWWENDGDENFTGHTIEGNFDGANSVYATDVDSDGDVDVLGSALYLDDITWWENDGDENFTGHTIEGDFNGANSVYATDVDGDGDVDVLGSAFRDFDIIWWENDGDENFTGHTIVDEYIGPDSVYATDMDGDGDVDVLGAASYDNEITWWENDGEENFTRHAINFANADSVYATDVDGDGDVDILGAGSNITWWENDGDENFTGHEVYFNGANSVYATDVDGDGDVDVLGAASSTSDIIWCEQEMGSTVSGQVTDGSGNPISGALLSYGAGYSTTTDSSGNYSLSGVVPGTYFFSPSLSGYTFSPTSQQVTVPPDAPGVDFVGTAAVDTHSISGQVTDGSSNPLSGVFVSDGAGHSTTTDSGGNYTLSGLVAGTYTVSPSLSGYTFLPTSQQITVPPDVMGVDFVGTAVVNTYSISGQVTDGSNNPLSGVFVSDGVGHITTTDSGGNYTLSGLAAGTYTVTPSLSGYTFSPTSQQVTVPPDVTGVNFTGSDAGIGYEVKVVDEENNPLVGASIYRNGHLEGDTGSNGVLTIPKLQVGDQLAARYRILEKDTNKGHHSQDSTQDWAYRVYIASVDIDKDGNTIAYSVTDTNKLQTLTVKKNNPLIGFNIVASVEWDASFEYLNELVQGLKSASSYLYDTSDGQMIFERVTIYENGLHWADADYQIKASNQVRPEANVDGILLDNTHVYLGRYWKGKWTYFSSYSTLIHEFGHYGIGLYDSYFYYWGPIQRDGACTSDAIKTNFTPDVNATIMDYQYNATELSMQDVAGLWSDQCEKTHQWQQHGKSDWETLVEHFEDAVSPARWQLLTPSSHGEVVEGPSSIAINDWMKGFIGNDADTGTCASDPVFQFTRLGIPWNGTNVWLRKSDGRSIYQGKTEGQGEITVLGAADGDKLVAFQKIIDLWEYSTQISCSSTQSLNTVSDESTVAILEKAPFTLDVAAVPGDIANQIEIRVWASTVLSNVPQVQVFQDGATDSVDVAMTQSDPDIYTGTLALDGNLLQSGTIEVNAEDKEGHSVLVFNTFIISSAKVGEDTIIYSADGQVKLYLPAGSLSADGRLGIAPDSTSGAQSEGLVILTGPYNIHADSGIVFNDSGNLAMRYLDDRDTRRNVDLSTVQIYRWDNTMEQWVLLESNVLEDNAEVAAPINAFGIYAAMAEKRYNAYLPSVLMLYSTP